MKDQLKNDLLEYLGELKNDREQENGWIEVLIIDYKINAVNDLLDFPRLPVRKKFDARAIVEEVIK